MARRHFASVDAYIASHREATRRVLQRVRRIIRKAVPGAEEVISYQIPTYKLDGRSVIYFAGWQRHYSVYPATSLVVATFADELAPYEVSKGTIRFPLSGPIPAALIENIAVLRANEAAGRAKPTAPKNRRARPKTRPKTRPKAGPKAGTEARPKPPAKTRAKSSAAPRRRKTGA
ncbi:MAG TPA: DUF1801 domain-containing protein [Kofleriaceae bacterium]|nr:DUF1801 domain-containing protein [Kofleriaceae bacterium]